MAKQRVLLVCSEHLFSESVERILRAAEEVELIGPWEAREDIRSRIPAADPGVVVIVDEDSQDEEAVLLTASILEKYPELPVIRASLTENIFRVFSTHSHPARGNDLLETIRNLPKAGKSLEREE